MARIVGVDLPRHKIGEIGLTYIYGVGRSTAQKVLDEAGVDRNAKVEEWTDDQINTIRRILNDNYKLKANCVQKPSLHQKAYGYRLLPGCSSQNRSAGQGTEYEE